MLDVSLSASSPDIASPAHPPVTMVFCCADGGKHYVNKNRRDAEAVHNELVAVMKSVLLHVSHIMKRSPVMGNMKIDVVPQINDANRCLAETLNLIKSTYQVPGGYFVRQQDGELKYMVAFSTPEVRICEVLYLRWISKPLEVSLVICVVVCLPPSPLSLP